MTARHATWRSDRRGVVALEFAIVAPVVLLVVLALFEVYRLLAAQRTLDAAVTSALRSAAVASTSATTASIAASVKTDVQRYLGAGGAADVTATVTFSPSYAPGNTVSIAATYAWSPLILPKDFAAVTLHSGGAFTVEN